MHVLAAGLSCMVFSLAHAQSTVALSNSDLAMLGTLYQRIGDESSSAPLSDTQVRRAWARGIYSDWDFNWAGRAHSEGVQAGTDLWADGSWRAGVYAGYLTGGAGKIRDDYSLGDHLKSRYLGAYATWKDASGFYVDSVLQGGSQRYGDSGKASSLTASIEAGKSFALNEHWSIEPQAQLIYQNTRAEDSSSFGGWRADADTSGWIGRLGARVKGDFATGAGRFQPYAGLDVYRGSAGTEVIASSFPWDTLIDSNRSSYSNAKAAVGATLALTPATSLYGEIGHLWNVGGDATVKSSTEGSLGVKVRW
ncbi:autotransporter outer membrane beta-barrel domain-containing protein [Variovorax sp. J31P207]|uniref:autotransporter outer membrane beta-barrel domain-containing protein n=1 Tax=Variovorax sp. J31P207 TaxID=3053510 RepID=UPI0025791F3C|nr:autotransporter outer membrane beta-barrel domain-containing protein [Variovorax sp. J31P207]MDM0064967.1 autotransporter outer membrane beta-barrel domain-containing protein [Variovorax sp. J31P207]